MKKEVLVIIILSALLMGWTIGHLTAPREWEKQDLEDYEGYCEIFRNGKFSNLNGYPVCIIN